MKIVMPALWVPMFGTGALTMLIGNIEHGENGPPKLLFLFAWIAGAIFVYWSCVRLKAVSVDEHYLYVSNYLKEIVIPLSEIEDVTENKWINIHPVTVHLKSGSEFGQRIMFMPTVRFFGFGSHPVVNELKELARVQAGSRNYW